MIQADTLPSHEFIGLDVEILDNTTATLRNISGSIINETKNTFLIKTSTGTKMLSKKCATSMRFSIGSGSCFISGSSLIGRPEDRISRHC